MDYAEFADEIFKITSIDLKKYKERQMKRRIETLFANQGFDNYSDYLKAVMQDKRLYDIFVNYLTINVSEFFRNKSQWDLLDKEIYPYIINNLSSRPLIWSAACSTGEEPYSLVMSLAEHIPLENIHVIASDIDRQVLEKARKGIYSEKSIKNIPVEYIDKYFVKKDDAFYVVRDEVKKCIKFRQHNLLEDKFMRGCDMIVCRNVLIYFADEAKKDIFIKFRQALKDGGVLFIGSTEQIMHAKELGYEVWKTFFYRKA